MHVASVSLDDAVHGRESGPFGDLTVGWFRRWPCADVVGAGTRYRARRISRVTVSPAMTTRRIMNGLSAMVEGRMAMRSCLPPSATTQMPPESLRMSQRDGPEDRMSASRR